MNILYVSPLCSERMNDILFRTAMVKPPIAVQKFHKLLADGFVMHGCNLNALSPYPVSRSTHSKVFWGKKTEKVNDIRFNYLPFINYPFLRQISIMVYGFAFTRSWIRKNKGKKLIIICDVLNISVAASALLAAKISGVHIVGIVTDLPGLIVTTENSGNRIIKKFAMIFYNQSIHSFSSYVFLTKQMVAVINKNNHPFCIIEGAVDINMKEINAESDRSLRNIIYAGGLYEKYGVKQLIDAFRQVSGEDLRLSIYGSGDMEKDMEKYARLDKRLRYYGIVKNSEVIDAERKAALLVNPRLTNAKFTEYSFPSKNLEYMVSGVPVLTTCLPGMPDDYYKYVFVFRDESLDGFVRTLSYVLSLPDEELRTKGSMAREFVLREKNNLSQTDKILRMINTKKL